jgi:hypothetical protein
VFKMFHGHSSSGGDCSKSVAAAAPHAARTRDDAQPDPVGERGAARRRSAGSSRAVAEVEPGGGNQARALGGVDAEAVSPNARLRRSLPSTKPATPSRAIRSICRSAGASAFDDEPALRNAAASARRAPARPPAVIGVGAGVRVCTMVRRRHHGGARIGPAPA